jgi:tRNA(fMet)-specific endonuclease VapC
MRQTLIDTNILSYFLKGDRQVINKINDYLQYHSYLTFSIFTYYEIKSGLLYRDAKSQMQRFEQLVKISDVVPFDEETANVDWGDSRLP